jgi:hypothetical protein
MRYYSELGIAQVMPLRNSHRIVSCTNRDTVQSAYSDAYIYTNSSSYE